MHTRATALRGLVTLLTILLALTAPGAHADVPGTDDEPQSDDKTLVRVVLDEADRVRGDAERFAQAYVDTLNECLVESDPESGCGF